MQHFDMPLINHTGCNRVYKVMAHPVCIGTSLRGEECQTCQNMPRDHSHVMTGPPPPVTVQSSGYQATKLVAVSP